jgi:hypothetical protein
MKKFSKKIWCLFYFIIIIYSSCVYCGGKDFLTVEDPVDPSLGRRVIIECKNPQFDTITPEIAKEIIEMLQSYPCRAISELIIGGTNSDKEPFITNEAWKIITQYISENSHNFTLTIGFLRFDSEENYMEFANTVFQAYKNQVLLGLRFLYHISGRYHQKLMNQLLNDIRLPVEYVDMVDGTYEINFLNERKRRNKTIEQIKVIVKTLKNRNMIHFLAAGHARTGRNAGIRVLPSPIFENIARIAGGDTEQEILRIVNIQDGNNRRIAIQNLLPPTVTEDEFQNLIELFNAAVEEHFEMIRAMDRMGIIVEGRHEETNTFSWSKYLYCIVS